MTKSRGIRWVPVENPSTNAMNGSESMRPEPTVDFIASIAAQDVSDLIQGETRAPKDDRTAMDRAIGQLNAALDKRSRIIAEAGRPARKR